ncbi:MAG: hypothetical protein ACI92S_005288, partial [Planctomycetaceae bacterium]
KTNTRSKKRSCNVPLKTIHPKKTPPEPTNAQTQQLTVTQLSPNTLVGTEFELCSGWHIHRHSFISAIGETLTPADAMNLVGHRTGKVHLGYRHTKHDKQAAAVESLDFSSSDKKRGTEVVRNSNRPVDAEKHKEIFSVNSYS